MPELPSGTVTMLFSDIEGSTSLVTRLGADWGAALSAQRRVVREVVAAHEGVEMGTEGDSFFVVYSSARQALATAVEVQRRLSRESWPGGVTLRVRIGLHTGEPQRHEEGYIGLDVHRAARIAAAAHGGQVVLSEETARLVEPEAFDVEVRDLGHHRLKDIPGTVRLYDVLARGLPSTFPPPRTLGSLTVLPTWPTELLGRDDDLAAATATLSSGVRLLTLLGPGGSGKTRLAVAVAERLLQQSAATVYFVDLHAATSLDDVWAGTAAALGVGGDEEETPERRVLSFLRERAALLVLDNLEQVPDVEVAVARLLDTAPGTRVLVTSRRPVHLVSEHLQPVAPLSLPADGVTGTDDAATSPAVALFVRRAQMVNPSFRLSGANTADVVTLCRRLDGLPLAIELVAARCRLLSPRAILNRLDAEPTANQTERDRSERQQTLTSTVAWSYDLLSQDDRAVFRRLAVFAGRVDLDALESVLGPEAGDPLDTVAHLVDVSLLTVSERADGEPVVSMLETVRRFARHRLEESGEADALRLEHARWCAAAATAAVETLVGPGRLLALDRLAALEDDLRAALDWALVPPPHSSVEQRDCGYRLLYAIGTHAHVTGRVAVGRYWRDRALQVLDAETAVSVPLVDALYRTAVLAVQRDDLEVGMGLGQRALEGARALADAAREARACNSLGIAHRMLGQPDVARDLFERYLELARAEGNPHKESIALTNLASVLQDTGDYEAMVETIREAREIDRLLGDVRDIAYDDCNLATGLLYTDGPEAAWDHLVRTARDVLAVGDEELAIMVVETTSCALAGLGATGDAAAAIGAADAERERVGLPRDSLGDHYLDRFLGPARAGCHPAEWRASYDAGRATSLPDALERALTSRSSLLSATASTSGGAVVD